MIDDWKAKTTDKVAAVFEVCSSSIQHSSFLIHHLLRMDALHRPHEFPGKLIIVEGIDGSGKSTQLQLAMRYLQARGLPVFFTEWNSADLVKAVTKKGKKKMMLTPLTFSLLHATDFAQRMSHNILPPLKAGMTVLADRYALHRLRP